MAQCAQCGREIGAALVCVHCGALNAPPPAPGNTPPPAAVPAQPAAPPAEPAAPAVATAPPAEEPPTPAAAAVQQEQKSGGCLWGIVGFAVVGLLLLCAGGIAFGIWHFRDKLSGMFAGSIPVAAPDSTATTPDVPVTPDGSVTAPAAGTGKVRVELTWSEPIDLDLEIWDAAGQNMVLRSSKVCGSDVQSGGTEYFVFDRYGSDDYTRGTYVVSVYFANSQRPPTASVTANLKITLPDGRSVQRSGVVHWERGQDQWHAFSIDASTGALSDLNRYITIRTPSSGNAAPAPRPSTAAPPRPANPSFPVRAPGK